MTTQTAPTKNQKPAATQAQPNERVNLSFQYGSIGIQAVAAAARYSDRRKSPAVHRIDQRFVESAV